eukprot:14229966-Alexandrium_andersonii.AAC.1
MGHQGPHTLGSLTEARRSTQSFALMFVRSITEVESVSHKSLGNPQQPVLVGVESKSVTPCPHRS